MIGILQLKTRLIMNEADSGLKNKLKKSVAHVGHSDNAKGMERGERRQALMKFSDAI